MATVSQRILVLLYCLRAGLQIVSSPMAMKAGRRIPQAHGLTCVKHALIGEENATDWRHVRLVIGPYACYLHRLQETMQLHPL